MTSGTILAFTSFVTILVFYCCHNKLSQIQCLKIMAIYYLTVSRSEVWEQCGSTGPVFRISQGKKQGVCRSGFLFRSSEAESTSKLGHVVGRILVLFLTGCHSFFALRCCLHSSSSFPGGPAPVMVGVVPMTL